MNPIRFSGPLVDSQLLTQVPEQKARAFRQAVAQLPEYITVDLKEEVLKGSDGNSTTDISGYAILDPALVAESHRELPDRRGIAYMPQPTFMQKVFPRLFRNRKAMLRDAVMEDVLKYADSIKQDVERWKAARSPKP